MTACQWTTYLWCAVNIGIVFVIEAAAVTRSAKLAFLSSHVTVLYTLHFASWMSRFEPRRRCYRFLAAIPLGFCFAVPLLWSPDVGTALPVHWSIYTALSVDLGHFLNTLLFFTLAPGSTGWQRLLISLAVSVVILFSAVATTSYTLVGLALRKAPVHVEILVSGVAYPFVIVLLGRVVLVDALTFVLHRIFPSINERDAVRWLVRNCKVAFFFSGQLVVFWISSFDGFCSALAMSVAADVAGLAIKASFAKRVDKERAAQHLSPSPLVLAGPTRKPAAVGAKSASVAPSHQAAESGIKRSVTRISVNDWLSHLKHGSLVDKLRFHYQEEEVAEKSLCFSLCLIAVLWHWQIRGLAMNSDLAARVAVFVLAEHIENFAKNMVFWATQSKPFLKKCKVASVRDGMEASSTLAILLTMCLVLRLVTGFEV